MNTDEVFFGKLGLSTRIDSIGTLRDYVCGNGIEYRVYYQDLGWTLIKIGKDLYYPSRAVDLQTNKECWLELPFQSGKVFVLKQVPFSKCVLDSPKKLSKRKILKIGRPIINAANKQKNN